MVQRAEGLSGGRAGWCGCGKDAERQGKWRDANVSGESKVKIGRRWALLAQMAFAISDILSPSSLSL